MKKNGFTLVELLAVIVILAVIALIATPVILDVIANSRRSAFSSSVSGIKDAIENDYGVRYTSVDFDGGGNYVYENGSLYYVSSSGRKENVAVSGGVVNGNGIGTVDSKGNVVVSIYNTSYCGITNASGVTVTDCDSAENCKANCGL